MDAIRFSAVCGVLVLTAALPAQQIWKVNCAGGPGVHFTDLPQAVAAAAPGDTVYVYFQTGSCTGGRPWYTAPTIDKPLRIVGFNLPGLPPGSGNDPGWALLHGELVVRGIATGECVTVSNVEIGMAPNTSWPPPPRGILVEDCDGSVLLEDVYFAGQGLVGAGVRFDNCADVTIRGCYFRLSGFPLTFVDSTALLSTVQAEHNTNPAWVFPASYRYTGTTESLLIQNSDVTLVGSLIEGAPDWTFHPQANWYAKPGAVVESGTLTIGPATALWGGYCPPCLVGREDSYYLPQPSQAQVFYDARALPLISWQPLPYTPIEAHATYHDWVVGGEDYNVSVVGPSNGWALLAVGTSAIQPLNIGIGMLAMDPVGAGVIGLQPLNSSGYVEWNLHCPIQAGVAHPFVFQAGVLDPITGAISLTVPSPFTVGWPHGQIP